MLVHDMTSSWFILTLFLDVNFLYKMLNLLNFKLNIENYRRSNANTTTATTAQSYGKINFNHTIPQYSNVTGLKDMNDT